jgi:hypothetical protein
MNLTQLLAALVLSIWAQIDPAILRHPEARPIADAMAQVAVEDASRAPVFSSHGVDLAVQAVYAAGESGVSLSPRSTSWDARSGLSCGIWQEPCWFVEAHPDPIAQARLWKKLLRVGQRECPGNPAAPLGGDCLKFGRPLAEQRVAAAREMLREALRTLPELALRSTP